MSPQPAGLTGAMKWLVLRYPEPKDTLIKLGSVLTDPYDPESSLTQRTNVVCTDDEDIRDHSNAVRHAVHTFESGHLGGSLNATIPVPSFFDGKLILSGDKTESNKTDVTALGIEAKVFNPSPDYMNKVLLLPEVVQRLRKTIFSQSLYLIIGVATAKGLSIEETKGENHKAEIEASLSVPAASVEEGVNISHDKDREYSAELSTSAPVDFAYRVREFEYRRTLRGGKLKEGKDVTEGALMGTGDEDEGSDDESYEDDFAEFSYFFKDDVEWEEEND